MSREMKQAKRAVDRYAFPRNEQLDIMKLAIFQGWKGLYGDCVWPSDDDHTWFWSRSFVDAADYLRGLKGRMK